MSFENTLRSATVAFCLMAPTLALADPAADARAAAERWDQAYNKGDMDGLKGLYVSDAMVIPKGAAVSGADSIQTFFSGLKSKGFDDHTVKVQAAQMRGDLLVATGRWQMSGPGGAYAPSVLADWHLLVGDEAALPAIAAALPRLPAGAEARVFIEVAGPEEEQDLPVGPGVELHWVHRGPAVPGEALVTAVRSAQLPTGTAQAFVHGEAHLVRELRSLVRVDLAVPRELMSVSGYWRLGSTEDRWQAEKRDWNAAIEAAEQVAAR